MTQQWLIGMQLLTNTLYHLFRYNITIANWNTIKNSTNAPDILFACLTTINLYYNLFKKLVESFLPFLISNTPKNSVVGIYYGQYDELVTVFYLSSDCNCYKEDAFDIDENNNMRVVEDRIADNYNDQGKSNNQNSDRDYIEE